MASYIKRANRSATLSFCPGGPFLAAGSVAGAIDLSFSTASQLEIFRLDFSSTDQDLRLAGGAVQAPERFSRLCWGPAGVDTKHYPVRAAAAAAAPGGVVQSRSWGCYHCCCCCWEGDVAPRLLRLHAAARPPAR